MTQTKIPAVQLVAATTSVAGTMSSADKTKLDNIETLADVTDAGNVGSTINGVAAKNPPVDADKITIIDSTNSSLKTVLWSVAKSTLKTYFDPLYSGGGGDRAYAESINPPASGTVGDRWFNTQSGILFTCVGDTDSNQWVEFSTGGVYSGGASHVIQDEGISVDARPYLDFVGSGVYVTDDSVNSRTIVTVSGYVPGLTDDWWLITETWAYASAITITVPSNATTKYQKGDKIRWKQGGAYLYAYIKEVAATLLTIAAGSDYSVANSTITDIALSRSSIPFGFPPIFNFVPSMQGYSSVPSTNVQYTFSLIAGICTVRISEPVQGTSDDTVLSFTAPIAARNITHAEWDGWCLTKDGGVTSTTPGVLRIMVDSGLSTVFAYQKTDSAYGTWTNSGGKCILNGFISYPI